jgi:hypothetical protein
MQVFLTFSGVVTRNLNVLSSVVQKTGISLQSPVVTAAETLRTLGCRTRYETKFFIEGVETKRVGNYWAWT